LVRQAIAGIVAAGLWSVYAMYLADDVIETAFELVFFSIMAIPIPFLFFWSLEFFYGEIARGDAARAAKIATATYLLFAYPIFVIVMYIVFVRGGV
jgi:hypothetical protein